MPGKRISELTALSGAASANNDDLLIFDSGAGETKRISRSQLAEGMVDDLPFLYFHGVLTSDPVQRLNGDSLEIGDGYLRSSDMIFRYYTASGWQNYEQIAIAAAQAWAEGTEPGGVGTYSSKEWAETARANTDGAEAAQLAAEAARDGSVAAKNAAEAAAEASGDVLFYDTKALANAALAGLSEGQVVEVFRDEDYGGDRVRYRVESGALVFKLRFGLEPWVFESKQYDLPQHPGQQANPLRNVFGFTALSPTTGRIFVIYRKGEFSENSTGSVHMQYSDDNGDTWSAEAELWSEADVNHTNLAGGCAENGNLVIFYVRYEAPWPTFLTLNYRVSTDNGATWGAEQTIDTTGLDLFSAYGKAEVLPNGDMLQCWYLQSPSYVVTVIKSTDDGLTWTTLATLPLTGNVTETDILSLGGGNVVTVSRVDGGSHYKMCTSADSGATWTYRGEIEQITFTNISPPWMEKFTDQFGRTVVAMYYYQRGMPSGQKPLRVIYAYADEIMSDGVAAFKTRSDRAIFSDGVGIGYPSAVHPFDDALGIGWTIERDDVRFFHSLESTPWGAHWQGRRLGLGGEPGDNHLFVKGRVAIGEGAQAGEAPQNGMMVQGQIGAGITDTVGSLPAAVVARSTTEQVRLEYSASVYAALDVSNVGYLGIVPTGKRVGIGTLSPVRTLHVHEQSTGPVRVKLTNDASGLYGGAEFYFASGIFYLTNADTGGITLASGPVVFAPAEISMANLPTADPLVAGRLWNDAGTVKVSAG